MNEDGIPSSEQLASLNDFSAGDLTGVPRRCWGGSLVETAGSDVDVQGEDVGVDEKAGEGKKQPEEDRATPAAESLPHACVLFPSPFSEEVME